MTSQRRQLYKVDTDCRRINKSFWWRVGAAYCKNSLIAALPGVVSLSYACTIRTGVGCPVLWQNENGQQ